MRLGLGALIWAATLPFAIAQSFTSNSSLGTNSTASASSNATSRNGTNGTLSTITTTITSLVPGPSGSSSSTSLLTLTLTLNTTSSASGNNSMAGNGTAVDNSTLTNTTEPWKEGDDWIPFNIRLDPAYGVLGALLILSGIPVAVLGGKNRWSSLAVVSGYALMLFTLVMILRFGVQDNLQPPSPNPPGQTLRGLYLLACIVACFIGAGIGIFLFNIAKYSVSAAGGFTLGWFLLELKDGGLITSVLGRWGLLGGLTVASTLASIVPKMAEPMMLLSTAWIGATAFILGVDCYTRAGLKEFYIYNLGFHDLFPKLEGAKYPLTQTMIIELGILAACVLIGGAIQAKVLSQLQRRLRTAKEEEEMRIEADEVSKAAERFKNVGSELAEWEEKHGKGKGVVSDLRAGDTSPSYHSASQLLPILGREQQPVEDKGLTSPSLPPLRRDGSGLYEEVPLASPTGRDMGTPTSAIGFYGVEQLKDDSSPAPRPTAPVSPALTDSELESKLKLLEEVKKARESIRGSIDELRRQTPTPSAAGRLDPGTGSSPATPALSTTFTDPRRASIGSRLLDEDAGRSRPISAASSYILDSAPMSGRDTRKSTTSSRLLDITQDTPGGGHRPGSALGRTFSGGSGAGRLLDPSHGRHFSDSSSPQPSLTEWDKYLADRQIMPPPPVPVNSRAQSQYLQNDASKIGRHEKTSSMFDLSTPALTRGPSPLDQDPRSRTLSMRGSNGAEEYQSHSMDPSHSREGRRESRLGDFGPGVITGSASSRHSANPNTALNPRDSMHSRSMTYDELSERHRKRISAIQEPVSSKMREEEDLRLAREKWERQKKAEKAEMERRQREMATREAGKAERDRGKVGERQEMLEKTDEWRRSVHGGLDGFGRPVEGHGRSSSSGHGHKHGHGSRDTSGGGTGRGREKRMSGMIN